MDKVSRRRTTSKPCAPWSYTRRRLDWIVTGAAACLTGEATVREAFVA